MSKEDIRWHQRLANYNKALTQLAAAVELSKEREPSRLEEQGLIQAFEFTHELARNVMKGFCPPGKYGYYRLQGCQSGSIYLWTN